MHGRPRRAPTPNERASLAAKASKLRSLQSQFLHFHHNKIFDEEALRVSADLLEANPEHYTAWNYRKLAVGSKLNGLGTNSCSETIDTILGRELELVENALKKNYKSYGAWYHRKWALSKGHTSADHEFHLEKQLKKELSLLDRFQEADARNFHAWNYRRFITTMKNVPDEKELAYTKAMIDKSISNYSAWHNLSVLLTHLLEKKEDESFPNERIVEESTFVWNALFTDPDDQSAWFYHFWLLDQTTKADSLSVFSWPSHGSSIYVSEDGSPKSNALYSYQTNTRTYPFILYFSDPVEGVNSSTVMVEYESGRNTDLTWTPISANSKNCAQAWITYLTFPEEKSPSSVAYQVNISLGHSEGIISSLGYRCQSSHIAFTVHVPPYSLEHIEGLNKKKVSWGDENFSPEETDIEEFSHKSFHQVSINLKGRPGASEWKLNTIATEIENCRELLSTMECKIGKLTLARLLIAQHSLMSCENSRDQSSTHYEVLQLYNDLMKLDPPHSQYYKDQHSLVLLKQVTSDQKFLQKYYKRYQDSVSPTVSRYFCLRLNNLSLSRIGCVEQLLWVQMLDLSHNQLRAIEGLEAMQLLSCLNLSHNKLCSFTALEPLRLLKSLEVLDISCNEIGEHSIDTERHLCSSPLTHVVGNNWSFDEYEVTGFEVTKYWDAYLIFKDLNLTQLDMSGNAVADDDKLKLLLCKLMPLKWLDGVIV